MFKTLIKMKSLLIWGMFAAAGISLSCGNLTDEVEQLLNHGDQLNFNGVTDLIILLGSTGVGKSQGWPNMSLGVYVERGAFWNYVGSSS
jgi:hypothetical protein